MDELEERISRRHSLLLGTGLCIGQRKWRMLPGTSTLTGGILRCLAWPQGMTALCITRIWNLVRTFRCFCILQLGLFRCIYSFRSSLCVNRGCLLQTSRALSGRRPNCATLSSFRLFRYSTTYPVADSSQIRRRLHHAGFLCRK